jgi:uncharacterized protein YbjT (DUF2867 family)
MFVVEREPMTRRILVLGATGMLGQSVTRSLAKMGNQVRVLTRDPEKARQMFGNDIEIVKGNALNRENIQAAMPGCEAVHLSLPQISELTAMQHLTDLGKTIGLERITYISATTACEANRWYDLIDVKMRTENVLRSSGIANTIFCPTWAMETLHNFIRGNRAVAIVSKNPPLLHFFAAADLGRMVAASYEDDRAFGKRLFLHGPESMTLPDAFKRFVNACYPGQKITRMKLWQAQWIAKLTGRAELADATRLIAYFDRVGELGDPSEANALLGAPSITLDEWFRMQKPTVKT